MSHEVVTEIVADGQQISSLQACERNLTVNVCEPAVALAATRTGSENRTLPEYRWVDVVGGKTHGPVALSSGFDVSSRSEGVNGEFLAERW